MSKYNDMREFYDKELKQLRDDRNYWRDRVMDQYCLCSKNEQLDKIVQKFINKDDVGDDQLFRFNNRFYRGVHSTLEHNPGEVDTLTVEFVECSVTGEDNKCECVLRGDNDL